jgi:ABC-2 type transport system ATP-binding protein
MLEAEEVTKVFDRPPGWLRPLIRAAVTEPVEALRSVSLRVDAGEIVGLVGPNGAGKTTLLKIICTLLEPTAGHVRVSGFDVTREPHEVCRRLGLVLEGDQGLFDRLTGLENLEFYGALAGMGRRAARDRAHETLELLGLAHRDKLVFGYSSGMRMRLSVGRALMADPPLLVLDEPTRSLDPLASRLMSDLIRDLSAQGRAVLLADHRLDEMVATCTRIVGLVHGEIRYHGTPEDLLESPAGAAASLLQMLEQEAQRP